MLNKAIILIIALSHHIIQRQEIRGKMKVSSKIVIPISIIIIITISIVIFSAALIIKEAEDSFTSVSQLVLQKPLKKLLITGTIATLMGITGVLIVANRISKPIKRLIIDAKTISPGRRNWNITIQSKDELAILSDIIRSMNNNLQKYIDSHVDSEKLATLGQLASGIAHEVRNPLDPIMGSAEVLQDLYSNDKTILKYTQIIKEEISILSSFLDDFLQFARPQSLKFQSVDINSLLKETLILMDHYIKSHQMRIVKNLSKNLPPLYADHNQLKQVFMNFILNAVQAKRKGEGLLKLKSSLEQNSDANQKSVIIEFFDYGQGIPLDNIKKIFDPFYTTKEKGTDLGLPICRNIIKQHGGKIEIDSGLGQWTLVQIILPVVGIQKE